jgi:hypothetical protein
MKSRTVSAAFALVLPGLTLCLAWLGYPWLDAVFLVWCVIHGLAFASTLVLALASLTKGARESALVWGVSLVAGAVLVVPARSLGVHVLAWEQAHRLDDYETLLGDLGMGEGEGKIGNDARLARTGLVALSWNRQGVFLQLQGRGRTAVVRLHAKEGDVSGSRCVSHIERDWYVMRGDCDGSRGDTVQIPMDAQ